MKRQINNINIESYLYLEPLIVPGQLVLHDYWVSKFIFASTTPYLNEGYWDMLFYMNSKDNAEKITKYVRENLLFILCTNGLENWKSINEKAPVIRNI